ncbi:MAG: cysteate synthase [Methanosarcinales archaeon]|nr:cysteate synthase [Methanosarcinales archaeon]
MGEYLLRCAGCGAVQPEGALRCQEDDGLLRTEYKRKQLSPADLPGIWTFIDWLPVRGPLTSGDKPVAFQSTDLARELGLENLWISFSGYWPERGARIRTCSFKELEAAPTMQRLQEAGDGRVLVVASAGNTARSFAETASLTGQPLVLVVPKRSMHRLWITAERGNICLVGVDGDYNQAIALGEKISSRPGFVAEGGARNVARRDGMGTVVLDAALTSGTIPGHYFQAIGSGTGGIAAWEASMRLVQDGRFGSNLPRLHLAQNLPCAPIYSIRHGGEVDRSCPQDMYDDVLFNRHPPYEVRGGVKDALLATGGDVCGITNQEAEAAQRLFQEMEDIDILPAAAVAVAALKKAAIFGDIKPHEQVLLNVTGGGMDRLKQDFTINYLKCDIPADSSAPVEEIHREINEVLGRI